MIFAHCALEMGMAEKILFCSKWKTIYSRVRCPFLPHHHPPLSNTIHTHIHTVALKTRCPFEWKHTQWPIPDRRGRSLPCFWPPFLWQCTVGKNHHKIVKFAMLATLALLHETFLCIFHHCDVVLCWYVNVFCHAGLSRVGRPWIGSSVLFKGSFYPLVLFFFSTKIRVFCS